MDKNSLNIYTDLALEDAEMVKERGISDGYTNTEEYYMDDKIIVSTVKILDENGAQAFGKPIGSYITIESQLMKENETEVHEEVTRQLAAQLGALHKLGQDQSVLIIGLGNQYVTPDALGPRVTAKVLVTRHLMDSLPPELEDGVRPVCALAPGVMGLTGIETAEIVKALVDKIHPDLVIAVDALAARDAGRINSTIQICDTGINPGAGMGNMRTSLNQNFLGVPVIGIGVPTVIGAAALVSDTISALLSSVQSVLDENGADGGSFYEMLSDMAEAERLGMIQDILAPYIGNMFVTPKEVDDVIRHLSKIIANALNIALHTSIDRDDINRYIS